MFTPISSDGREGLVVEFFDADFLPPGARPQQSNTPMVASEGPSEAADPDTGREPRARAPALIPGLAKKGTDNRTTVTLPGQRPATPAPAKGPNN